MYGRLILGYDGSEQSHDALALARMLASDGRRSVVVSHVTPQPLPYDSRTREYATLVREHDHAVLDPALAALAELTVEAHPIESTSPARGLHELTEEEGASLVVIGSTHRGPMGRVVVGSTGELLLSGTPAAVAVAPRGYAAREPSAIRTVSAGFNLAEEGRAALAAAAAFAAEVGARLRAIAVDEGTMHARHSTKRPARDNLSLEETLDGALADVQAPDAERVVVKGSPAARLAECCADSELLVIGSRSYGPLHHALVGSVSAKLMRSCPAPLLVVPRGASGARGDGVATADLSRAGSG